MDCLENKDWDLGLMGLCDGNKHKALDRFDVLIIAGVDLQCASKLVFCVHRTFLKSCSILLHPSPCFKCNKQGSLLLPLREYAVAIQGAVHLTVVSALFFFNASDVMYVRSNTVLCLWTAHLRCTYAF